MSNYSARYGVIRSIRCLTSGKLAETTTNVPSELGTYLVITIFFLLMPSQKGRGLAVANGVIFASYTGAEDLLTGQRRYNA